MSGAEAREYLALLKSKSGKSRGPLRWLGSREEHRLASELGERVLAVVTSVGKKTWRAPSPWHAAVWLHNLSAGVSEGKPVQPPPKGEPNAEPFKFSSGLLYRGQRDPRWQVNPSWLRLTPDERKREGDAQLRMMLALQMLSGETELPAMRAEAHIAVAQHYGLRTYLLDMTMDPAVATFFACDGAADGEQVVVYWLPFQAAVELGVRVIMPPPWVERIYRQRGLFLDFSLVAKGDIKDDCYQILFPADRGYLAEFEGEATTLFPDHHWFQGACRWARRSRIPVTDGTSTPARRLARAVCRVAGKPSFVADSIIPLRLLNYFDLLEEMLDWLALRVRTDLNYSVDCLPVRILWRDNQGFIDAILISMHSIRKWDARAGADKFIVKYLDAIHACLEASGETLAVPAGALDLKVKVEGAFKVEEDELARDILTLAKEGAPLPNHLRVRVAAPGFEELCAVVQAQSERQTDATIAAEQREQLATARSRMERLERCASALLLGLSFFYDARRVVRPARLYFEQGLLQTLYSLASYQVDDGTAVYHDFRSWVPGDFGPAVLAQTVYAKAPLLDVTISPMVEPPSGTPFATVYLPPERLENDGSGGLLTSIWESAEHIPEDIWIDYVVPQLVLAWMNGGPEYTPWTRDRAFYCTEGVLWAGDQQHLDTSRRIAGTNVFLVPKE